jgi:hypothetical protein
MVRYEENATCQQFTNEIQVKLRDFLKGAAVEVRDEEGGLIAETDILSANHYIKRCREENNTPILQINTKASWARNPTLASKSEENILHHVSTSALDSGARSEAADSRPQSAVYAEPKRKDTFSASAPDLRTSRPMRITRTKELKEVCLLRLCFFFYDCEYLIFFALNSSWK